MIDREAVARFYAYCARPKRRPMADFYRMWGYNVGDFK